MLRFDFSALRLPRAALKISQTRKNSLLRDLSAEPFFTDLPSSKQAHALTRFVRSIGAVRAVVVIGIGASDLAAKAVLRALPPHAKPDVRFLETTDPDELTVALRASARKPALSIVVSDSGETTETVANFLAFRSRAPRARFCVITKRRSPLWTFALREDIPCIETPPGIHGRFSTFTAVCLAPLAAAGTDIEAFLRGARDANRSVDVPLRSATASYYLLKHGKPIHNLFMFDSHLEDLGKWWRQLIAESLGKRGDGFTPLVSVGSTDLHSLFQLYLDGPKDKFATFVEVSRHGARVAVPRNDILPALGGKSFRSISDAIRAATKKSFRAKRLPFMEVLFPALDAYHLGYFMETKLAETYLLGKLMGVNPFNQPAVELYKRETRRILGA